MHKLDVNIHNLQCKKSFSKPEMYGIIAMVESFNPHSDAGELPDYEEAYGFVYQSTGKYAIYGVSEEVFFKDEVVAFFAITEDGRLIMVTHDWEENESYYEITSDDLC